MGIRPTPTQLQNNTLILFAIEIQLQPNFKPHTILALFFCSENRNYTLLLLN